MWQWRVGIRSYSEPSLDTSSHLGDAPFHIKSASAQSGAVSVERRGLRRQWIYVAERIRTGQILALAGDQGSSASPCRSMGKKGPGSGSWWSCADGMRKRWRQLLADTRHRQVDLAAVWKLDRACSARPSSDPVSFAGDVRRRYWTENCHPSSTSNRAFSRQRSSTSTPPTIWSHSRSEASVLTAPPAAPALWLLAAAPCARPTMQSRGRNSARGPSLDVHAPARKSRRPTEASEKSR